MIRCEHARDCNGSRSCEIVRQLSDLPIIECRVGEDACSACIMQAAPQTTNHVTISMALSNTRRADPERYSDLVLVLLAPPDGVGTELSAIIEKWFKIEPTPTCPCKQHAAAMNRNGIAWCEQNVQKIVNWLAVEAKARGMIFSKIVARQVVCLAIRRAKRTRDKLGAAWHGVP